MLEPDKDLVAKMLRAVLQSNKNGVPFPRLQSEYKSLTGEYIPFKDMGFHTLEAYIKAIPTVVRIEVSRGGEVICHAVVCKETAQIAELVARQRSSKKKSGGQVNCQMRLKYSVPFTHFGKPKAMLRKPGFASQPDRVLKRPVMPSAWGKGAVWSGWPPANPSPLHSAPVYGAGLLKEVPVQRPQPIINRPERKVTLPPRFQKEANLHTFQQTTTDSNANETQPGKPALLGNFHPNLPMIQCNLRDLFSKHGNGISLSKLPQIYKETFKHDLSDEVLKQIVNWTHICTVQRPANNNQNEIILYATTKKQPNTPKINQQNTNGQVKPNVPSSASKPSSPAELSAKSISSAELKGKVCELLSNYSSGLWLHALPKVFEDAFKITFPLETFKVAELSDICTIQVISENPYKGILYAKPIESVGENLNVSVNANNEKQAEAPSCTAHSAEEESDADMITPPLVIPSEASPSVLVVELNNTQEVVIRYVGEDYSAAQERMEDEMKEFYIKNANPVSSHSLKLGQLVAVKAEEEAWLRAQISAFEDNKIKVLYVDYGFSEVVDCTKVSRLSKPFYSLPFQATKCRLAGLEAFCDDPVLVKEVEAKACGKILAVEMLQKTEKPLVILYDTSGDDDININSICLRELCDRSLSVQLKVNSSYTNVIVTNVCSDGTLFCQVPSKGLTKLYETLQKVETHFNSKTVTSDLCVSLPFCGKICLFQSKGKWTRVEITSVHSSRTIDVKFLDSGTIASVKVSELKEIPSQYLRDIISIPPQATRCCLADLPHNIGMWTPDAVLWLRNAVLNCSECSIKVVNIDGAKRMVYVYLFTSKNFADPERSVNRQITNVELWKQKNLPSTATSLSKGRGDASTPTATQRKDQASIPKKPITEQTSTGPSLDLPPPLPLPKSSEHMDVFVSVACHPGHFVFQPWQELHKLEVVMEEMLLHYSSTEEKQVDIEKNKVYAAKVDNKWYRVLLKGILTNGMVSVYELDYGRHELVNSRKVQPLIEKFRQLPFQAVTSQLAGIKCDHWSEEASIVFRNHVENKPLVALIQAVQESTNPWDRKVVVYLVDTSLPDTDLWVHDIMSEYLVEFSKPQ
ncbi:PREDICTED: tudor domain-containing protein 7 [Nanorana parkeri]|uniref:tudor domain-containing protein 7 n=1 Tax=Nanorana parkeri TaxID=125878 RepID=UPI000854CDB0|nr:PREDICTED: tudor domain-containing protein 7 [Nanorana parkeri]